MEELQSKLAIALEDQQLIIQNPHTVWTVANVLDFNLTQEQRMKAGLLAYKIFKHINVNQEPLCCEIFLGGGNVNRYSNDDIWIVKLAVKKIALGRDCHDPPPDKLSNEPWVECCNHQVKYDDVIFIIIIIE